MNFQIDPTETPATAPEATMPAVVVKPSLEQEVAAWSKTDAELRAVVEATKGITIKDHVGGEKKGREAVHGALMTLVKSRTAIEGRKAELKRPALDLCNLIETESKRLLAITTPREAELRKERDDWDAEQARIAREAEQARQAKIQARLDAMSAAGIPVDLVRATELSDEAWTEYLGKALEAKAKLDAATKVAEELTALGDECTAGEALQLTDEQIEHRLAVARKADHDRKEAARIQREEDEANRKRLETGALRVRELALLGAPADLDTLADMTPEAYAVALETATQDKADREKKARDDADELERLRKLAAPKVEPVAEVVHAPDPEILPEPWPVVETPDDESALVRGICSTHDYETEPQKIAAWARAVLDGMPSTPAITSASLADRMVATVDGVRESLLALERAMGEA